MPNYEPHVLLRWGGTLGEDTWTNGLRIRHPSQNETFMTGWANTWQNDLAAAVFSWFNNPASHHNGLCRLGWVKVNAVNAAGRYIDQGNTNLIEYPGAGDPPPSGNTIIAQAAWCVTLRTAKKRGRAHAGRFYVPTLMVNTTETGVIAQNSCQVMADAAQQFIQAVNDVDLANDGTWVGVFSPLEPLVERVTRVEVGNVVDTQQRRRRQITETYFGADV